MVGLSTYTADILSLFSRSLLVFGRRFAGTTSHRNPVFAGPVDYSLPDHRLLDLHRTVFEQIANRWWRFGIVIAAPMAMYLWFWANREHFVPKGGYSLTVLLVELVVVGTVRWLLLHGRDAMTSHLFVKMRSHRFAALFLGVCGVLALGAAARPAQNFLVRSLQNTPFFVQNKLACESLALASAIDRHVPEDGRILTAPYFVRQMTKRYIHWTKKDANAYFGCRDLGKLSRWHADAKLITASMQREGGPYLPELMRSRNCRFIVVTQDLEGRDFELLYSSPGSYRLYRILEETRG